jgi:hypothetical protein
MSRDTPNQERSTSLAYAAMLGLVVVAVAGLYALTVGYEQLW